MADVVRSGAWVSPTVNTGFARFFAEDGSLGKFAHPHEPGAHAAASARARRSSPRPTRGFPGSRTTGCRRRCRCSRGWPSCARSRRCARRPRRPRAFGLEAETGRLAPGLSADVLVVDGNPLEDLGALLRPVLVLARAVGSRSGAESIGVASGTGAGRRGDRREADQHERERALLERDRRCDARARRRSRAAPATRS